MVESFLSQTTSAELAEIQQAVRNNFVLFCDRVLKDDKGRPTRMAPIHIAWAAHVEYAWARGKGALINAPMGHAKSSYFGVGLPLYTLGQDVNNRIKIISAAEELACDRVVASRKYIDEDLDFRRLCPHVRASGSDREENARKTSWARKKLQVQRPGMSTDASIEAKGMDATGAGGRADLVIFDDPVDLKNSRTLALRRKIKECYEKTWMTRLMGKSNWMMISTPYHHEDLNADLTKNSDVVTLKMAISQDFERVDFTVFGADEHHPLYALAA